MATISKADMKRLNEEAGRYFFSQNTMRFFNSRIETTGLISKCGKKAYFVTSERYATDCKRVATLREIDLGNGIIQAVGEKGTSIDDAKALRKSLAESEK